MWRAPFFTKVVGNSLSGGASEHSNTCIRDGFGAAWGMGLGANQYRGNRGKHAEGGARVQQLQGGGRLLLAKV